MTIRANVGVLCGSVMLGAACAAVPMGAAAGPSYDLSNRARIEQDIRRTYNQRNYSAPSAVQPRIREQHLRDGVLLGPAGTAAASCAYQYGRWKRTGSKYWQNRYFDCAG